MNAHGLLVIDKPAGLTSREALNRVQAWFPRGTKVGHTGTLDPLATGVLVVCVGAATRLADYVQALGKSYHARFRLGAISTTDDADGAITERPAVVVPTREQVEAILASFVGTIEQVPPAYSALKVAGERAHALARHGQEVRLAARPVRIDAIRLLAYDWPFLDVAVDCGKGTYIRSLARDVGEKLGVGGLVQTLRRTRVGPFTAEQAVEIANRPARLTLLPAVWAVDGWPRLTVSADDVRRLRQGQAVRWPAARPVPPPGTEVAVVNEAGDLVAIGITERGGVRARVVLTV